jgi:hypothetical protein
MNFSKNSRPEKHLHLFDQYKEKIGPLAKSCGAVTRDSAKKSLHGTKIRKVAISPFTT